MTFQNLIDFCQSNNINLFENCTVPAPFNIDLVIDAITSRCGLLTPIYGEPLVFKELTHIWFYKNQWNFEHLAKIYNADYSPIENVYESDHWTEYNTGTDSRVYSGSDVSTLSGEDTLTHGETHTLSGEDTLTHGETHTLSGTDTETTTRGTEHTVSAYNATGYQPDSQDVNSGDLETEYGKTDTASGDDVTEYGRTDTASGDDVTAYGKTDTLEYGKTDDFTHGHNIEYTRLRHGNVGVTTNNQLINEELSMLDRFNPYDWIAAKFERENFLQIY